MLLVVPRDYVASRTEEANDRALEYMAIVLKAAIRPSTKLEFNRFLVKVTKDEEQ